MPTATSPQPRRRAPFTPRVRGDLPAALQGSEAFVTVAPAVPRPATYLLSPELLAWAPEATARDLALWETLLTLAQGPDGSVQDLQLPRIAGVRQALAALSAGGRQAQPRELVDSLHRLFGRERAPLKLKSEFDYRLPSFLGDVLVPGRYGHLDLVTLARFRHRASALLYRRLVGELAASKARYVAGGAPHRIELTPIELAAAMGLSDVRVGQLKAAYLAPALGEIAEHVRAFRVVAEEAHGEKRPGQLHAPLSASSSRSSCYRPSAWTPCRSAGCPGRISRSSCSRGTPPVTACPARRWRACRPCSQVAASRVRRRARDLRSPRMSRRASTCGSWL